MVDMYLVVVADVGEGLQLSSCALFHSLMPMIALRAAFFGVENLFWKTKSFLEVQSIHQNHEKGLVVKPRRGRLCHLYDA